MKLFVVTKSPVGLDGAAEMVGGFLDREEARAACRGAGTYTIYGVETGRLYGAGNLLDSEVRVVVDHREVCDAPSINDCLINYLPGAEPIISSIKHLPSGSLVTFDIRRGSRSAVTKESAFAALVERMQAAAK